MHQIKAKLYIKHNGAEVITPRKKVPKFAIEKGFHIISLENMQKLDLSKDFIFILGIKNYSSTDFKIFVVLFKT